MKHALILCAAAAPLAALGADQSTSPHSGVSIDQRQLQNSVPVTDITGKEVVAPDGRTIGEVQDVLLDLNGKVLSLIVSRESEGESDVRNASDVQGASYQDEQEQVAALDGGADVAQRNGASSGNSGVGGEHARVAWNDVIYDAQENVIRLSGEQVALVPVQYDEDRRARGEGFLRANRLVGMDVNLTDKESYGEVQDVLIDTRSGEASAIVVDGGGLFTSETRALPPQLGSVNTQDGQVTLQHTEQEVQNAEEFDLESITDQT